MADDIASSKRDTVAFGIEGHYRVGCWTGIRASVQFTSIETRDGDGVQVEYRQPSPVGANNWGYVIPGSEAAPVVLSNENQIVAQHDSRQSDRPREAQR